MNGVCKENVELLSAISETYHILGLCHDIK